MLLSAEQIKHDRLIEKLKRELGSAILSGLSDTDVIEIMLNDDGHVWFDSLSNGMYRTDEIIEPMRAYNIISTVATLRHRHINEKELCVECVLPIDGSRFTAVIPEAVENACFNIRKKATRIFTLDEYIKNKIITEKQANLLRNAILKNHSILITGGPGTGKTTFANALLGEMVHIGSPEQRFVILEETPELQCLAKNKITLRTTANLSFVRALRHALVARPDKICVGECRGAEVLTLLKAWNTGTKGGLSTLHANSASAALSRIEGMIQENEGIKAEPTLIVEAIDVICAMSFDSRTGRKVNDILRVTGHDSSGYQLEKLDH
jgi:type IV secretion system protein VirB11